ncbi:ABC transporter ATP-binding protein [Salipiger abyssi]|uniref:NitT/TauT family transport system ATP-binding protein n=1 Tax=Salipiger abyssi TaxID=1250539 RepID=A0A1P8V0V1_9RHOB|nr:NitT/TauT family transport system ATP-binding protein [Salipiger abyssi]
MTTSPALAAVSAAPDPATRPEIIRYENVGKAFGALQAVTDINLTVHEGEFITLVGPSGCGKSTLLNMAAGIFAPTSGAVSYRGEKVSAFNRKVGYMTQSDHLLHWRTVAGNIAVPLEIAGLSKKQIRDRIEDLLDLVGLKGFGDNYPNELSGGMRKRCALARLLAYDPETLLFDEPFAALDAQLRLKMQVEVRRIATQLKKSILFVTHDLDEAVALADRCAIFTSRPGTIREVLDIPLPPDRDLFHLRHNRDYVDLTARLWDEMAPAISAEEH